MAGYLKEERRRWPVINIPNKFIILKERHIQMRKPYQLPGWTKHSSYYIVPRAGIELTTFCLHSFIVAKVSHMASHMHDRDTRLNMSLDVNVPLGGTHYMRRSFIYRGAVAWNALPNDNKNLGSLSAFTINLKHYIRALWISTYSVLHVLSS